jgi:large subunit ribosomal protein L23
MNNHHSERLYTVLVEPHISEKISLLGDSSNKYAFKVVRDASKREIKKAVEALFQVVVTNVSVLNVKGKVKRTAKGLSRRKSWKKAYISVQEGQEIDFMVVE